MDKSDLSDERLVFLHQQKKINAFFIIYERYKNYGYSIVYRKLSSTPYLNALIDEKNAIVYESIMDAFSIFDDSKGEFRCLLSSIIEHRTLNAIRKYRHNPICDCVLLDESLDENEDLKLLDTIVFADPSESPKEYINKIDMSEKINNIYRGHNKERIKKMLELKEQGYKVVEIASILNTTPKAVRSIFYRIRRKIDNKINKNLNR